MGFAVDVNGKISNEITDGKLETLKKSIDMAVAIKHFDAIGYNRGSNEEWNVIPPAELVLSFKQDVNVEQDFDNTDIQLQVKPIEIMIGFADIEMFIEYATNLLKVMKEYGSEQAKKIPGKSGAAVKAVQVAAVQMATKPLTNRANMKVFAEFEKLGITAKNDKARQKHSLAKVWIGNLMAKVDQDTVSDVGVSRNVEVQMGTFQCELDQLVDFIDKENSVPFM